ncbi:RNA-binding domain-containing protein [Piedraia hortae CBS 480.64]|uniref:RNA-binding domain-containing protein n=1 Tax=Piedraia hortae CBS 480.64 TaxID=1314780 RepID=A0A6A7C229_9PEZI|nr:RNA-binding domain-containing protein [Piedraia hortae CBS 480.64]
MPPGGSKSIAALNKAELAACVAPSASWHTDYRDTAYIYIGNLPHALSEGDIITIFSQYGRPVHIHLARDKETGKSRGFAWLKYYDQRSTDLAVDNLDGADVLGRGIKVDHARYKLKEGERETVGETDQEDEGGSDGRGGTPERRVEDVDNEDPMMGYLRERERERKGRDALRKRGGRDASRRRRTEKGRDESRRRRRRRRSTSPLGSSDSDERGYRRRRRRSDSIDS